MTVAFCSGLGSAPAHHKLVDGGYAQRRTSYEKPVADLGIASLRDNYAVSCPELNLVVDTSKEDGALGSRMVGGGFGGSAIALMKTDQVKRTKTAVSRAFSSAGFNALTFLYIATKRWRARHTQLSVRVIALFQFCSPAAAIFCETSGFQRWLSCHCESSSDLSFQTPTASPAA